jgi:uncharacterized protein YdhG (YjbR/CyaY superfamily)
MKKIISKDGTTKKNTPAKDIDDYLSVIPEEVRTVLEKLRQTIKKAAPNAEEVISYQMPAFKYYGLLVSFAAFKNHCSFFPMNSTLIKAFKDELKPYDTAKGTIRFSVDKPLPATLVKKIVKIRIKENESRVKKQKWNSKKKIKNLTDT